MDNKLVFQANTLIEASYKLKPSQQKFLRVMASMINFGDEDFKMYEFKVSELMELYGIKDQSKYSEIPRQTKELMGNVLTFKNDKKEVLVPFLSFYEHEKGEGTVRVQFHPFLKPFYLHLNKENPYTKYQLKNIVSLKSTYSIRFYELLKQYEGISNRTFSLEEIREIFKIAPKEYTRYNDFKRFVVLQAQKELKEKTDIIFDFEEIKTGRRVTSIKFFIKSNRTKKVIAPKKTQVDDEVSATKETPYSKQIPDQIKIDDIESDIKLIMEITENQFTKNNAMTFRNVSNGDIKLIAKAYEYMKTMHVDKSKVGYMRRLLQNFDEPQKLEKVGIDYKGFNNFKARDYDYDTLERKLLGWEE